MMTLNSEGVNLRTLQVKEIGDDAQGFDFTNGRYRYPRQGRRFVPGTKLLPSPT